MKTHIFALVLLLAPLFGNSQAKTSQPEAPDVYELTGGKLHIAYSTTSKNGEPHFTYRDGRQTLSFSGGQIRQTKTEVGTLVTVTLRMTVDTGSTSFTLLVPTVNLASPTSTATIHTVGITTVHRFSVVPAANRGQTEIYTTTELSGTASIVNF
jgi:hypothetical protein